MKAIYLTLALAAALPAAEVFTGVITDTMCGAKHGMMKGQSDEQCIAMCMKGANQFALYDGKNVWKLSDQKTPAKLAAKRVKVTGTLDAKTKTIKVTAIQAE